MLWCVTPVLFALSSAYGIIWMMSRHNLTLAAAEATGPRPLLTVQPRTHDQRPDHSRVGDRLFFTSLPKEIIALAAAGIHLASPKFRTEELLGWWTGRFSFSSWDCLLSPAHFNPPATANQAVQWLAHGGFNLNVPRQSGPGHGGVIEPDQQLGGGMLLLKVIDVTHPSAAYVLALANSFGGSLIIIGSVSNIIVVQQAREMEVNISFRDFARLGVPVTLAAMAGLLAWVTLMTVTLAMPDT